ncbi:hypothetical protein B0181_03880 [Moraxella caviae]|uniref:Uncharacterized protein n=1 Tax=Moraxella caviae TaxID=34060 RepID=A0A1T0A658_9GAMM|nr:hypothetical protein B0181_03880 [Moraxella caviae]
MDWLFWFGGLNKPSNLLPHFPKSTHQSPTHFAILKIIYQSSCQMMYNFGKFTNPNTQSRKFLLHYGHYSLILFYAAL